ncbi:MAG: ABC transporter ATP-binding protein/permease [Treponema sp.]|jgi:ATP-binding cassette subfamily B protein|nr:ABC transporter ATP-binding protein/permease [Treponema sp.]
MKRILTAYKDLLRIIFAEAPVMGVLVFVCAVIIGLLAPFGIYVNQNVFDLGLEIARGERTFSGYPVFLVLFAVCAILPNVFEGYIWRYAEPRSLVILRTAYKARMLKKLKTMKYEHYENEASTEIIDKAYNRAENSARHLWPNFVYWWLFSLIASIGSLAYIASIRWWLVLTMLLPWAVGTYIAFRQNYNIYTELEKYWNKERRYSTLGWYLRSRDFSKELKAFGNAGYLIDTYKNRLNERNREYEKYFFRNLRKIILGGNFAKLADIANVIILLVLFINGQISVGLFIAISGMIFTGGLQMLDGAMFIFKWAPYHINFFDYYDKFFRLSDEPNGTETKLPESFDIEFKDVWFRYPGTEKDILKGLTFKIHNGEKASIVGENGEGKSTMIKLLLGLFSPDRGEITVGGKNLDEYPLSVRTKIFGPVFQDFPRYSITVKENISIGDIDEAGNDEKINAAANKGKVDQFIEKFEKSYDTLLGRDFEGGVDISGGQWQRVAIARAFMGGKPVLLLDEPTSQLDPMAEADLYNEFAAMVENKTAVFITHRLGSTMITDRILVISGGKIEESGTHDELMQTDGIYSKMFNAQKQWYAPSGRTREDRLNSGYSAAIV